MKLAPVSKLPGEKTCDYQPSIKLPEPFARNVFKKDDVTNLNKPSRDNILSIIKNSNYGFMPEFSIFSQCDMLQGCNISHVTNNFYFFI